MDGLWQFRAGLLLKQRQQVWICCNWHEFAQYRA